MPIRKHHSPSLKAQNSSLQQIFKPRRYPTIYFAKIEKDNDGKIQFKTLGQIGGVDPKRCGNKCYDQWIATANQQLQKK